MLNWIKSLFGLHNGGVVEQEDVIIDNQPTPFYLPYNDFEKLRQIHSGELSNDRSYKLSNEDIAKIADSVTTKLQENKNKFNTTVNIQAVDAEQFAELLSENQDEIIKLIQNNIASNGKLRGTIKKHRD